MTEVISLHPPHSAETDNAEWRQTVDVLQASVRARDPDGLSRVSYFIRKLEQERGPLVSSLAVMHARLRGQGQTIDEAKEATARARVQLLDDRLADLRHIISRARSTPKDSHDGPTPETRQKGGDSSILQLPEGLRQSAEDLRCGWMVRSPTEMHAKAVKLELEAKGYGEYGKTAELMEHQYLGWLQEMRRIKWPVWCVDEVVCRGRSITESAKLHKLDPAAILYQVTASLSIYHALFPPIDTTRKAGV